MAIKFAADQAKSVTTATPVVARKAVPVPEADTAAPVAGGTDLFGPAGKTPARKRK